MLTESNNTKSPKLICVDLGCGKKKEKGFIGVDIVAGDQVDVIADLNQGFPFPDHSVDIIKAHDFIEHLPDRIKTMNELWRICKPNAIVDIFVPSTDGRGAFQDPTHVSFWNLNSFMYYCQEYPPYLELCRSHYGFQGEFKIIKIEQIESALQIIHVHVVLQAIKSAEIAPLKLNKINLIIFPDWNQKQELIYTELVNLFQVLIHHPKNQEISLLIDTQNIALEEVNFLIADVLMNICYENEIENNGDQTPIVNFLQINSLPEYQGLIPVLNGLIVLETENKQLIEKIGFNHINSLTLDTLKNEDFSVITINKSQVISSNKIKEIPTSNHNLLVRPNSGEDNPLWQ